jgi:exosortase family protein XrtM
MMSTATPLAPILLSSRRHLALQAACFLAAFIALQTLWRWGLAGGALDVLLIDMLTVKAAVVTINFITPALHAIASGRHINAPGGGIHIGDGCEGATVLFLLMAALIALPATWRRRLGGVLAGAALVYLLNQIRLIALFYAYRSDRALFGLLHHTVAPLAMIAAAALFFLFWSMRQAPSDDAP